MRNRLLLLLALHLPLLPISADALEGTYCEDRDEQAKWGAMLHKYPGDKGIVRLFALRYGLCEMIKAKLITVETADEVFNPELANIIEKRQREKASKDEAL